MSPRTILDGARERVPLAGHVGKSGASLERVRLADGRSVVVKRLRPSGDFAMTLTHDTTGREYEIWASGLLDRLPPGIGHAVVDGWPEADGAVLVMRDLGDTALTWDDRLDRDRWLFVVERIAALHRSMLGRAPDGLTDLDDFVGLFAPQRTPPELAATELFVLVARGWQHFADLVPPDVARPVADLLADPGPLVTALGARPATLIHGDLATVNMALAGDTLVLLDWSLTARAPGAVDVARFVAGCASVVDVPREQLLADYAEAAGPAWDAQAMRLGLLVGLLWLGWNKALDAAEHPDPAIRSREREDLDWWVEHARPGLHALR